MIRHWIEPKRTVLRAVIECDLPEILHAAQSYDADYPERLRQYLGRVAIEMLHVAKIVAEEPETGTVKWFDEAKGYGFIRSYDQQDVFVHYRQIDGDGYRTLEKGQRVRFKRRMGRETLEAIDVRAAPLDPIEEEGRAHEQAMRRLSAAPPPPGVPPEADRP
jgi:CspA family cold shock protein